MRDNFVRATGASDSIFQLGFCAHSLGLLSQGCEVIVVVSATGLLLAHCRGERTGRPPRSPWLVEYLENDGALYTSVRPTNLLAKLDKALTEHPDECPLEDMKRFAVEYRDGAARLAAVLLAHAKT